MVEDRDDGRRLEPAERRLEDVLAERVEIAGEGHEHRLAARLEEGHQEHLSAGDHLALAASIPEAWRDLREQGTEDRSVVVPPRRRVEETAAAGGDVRTAGEAGMGDPANRAAGVPPDR